MIKSKILVNTCQKCGLLKAKTFSKEGERFKKEMEVQKLICRCK